MTNRAKLQAAGRIILTATLLALGACAVPQPSAADEPPGTPSFHYRSVAAVYREVEARPGSRVSSFQGWTMVEDSAAAVSWSFAPASDPAYPAVIKRSTQREGNDTVIKTCILCESSNANCHGAEERYENVSDAYSRTASRD